MNNEIYKEMFALNKWKQICNSNKLLDICGCNFSRPIEISDHPQAGE